jgi:hypothetical protein
MPPTGALLWLDIDDLLEQFIRLVTTKLHVCKPMQTEDVWWVIVRHLVHTFQIVRHLRAVDDQILFPETVKEAGLWIKKEYSRVVEIRLADGFDQATVRFIFHTPARVDLRRRNELSARMTPRIDLSLSSGHPRSDLS